MAWPYRRLCLLWRLHLILVGVDGQDLINAALGKPATQSTYHWKYGFPQNVVDGSRADKITLCTHTEQDDVTPWWRVDLGGLFEVYAVVITNRNCCPDNLANFEILVSPHLLNASQSRPDTSALCLYYGAEIAASATERLNCSQPIAGRYVTLLKSTVRLNLCELEVLGIPAVLVARTGVYQRQADLKAPGDVIKEIYVRNAIHCTASCTEEPGCTAVNLQSGGMVGRGVRRECELLAYGGDNHPSGLVWDQGWNFYKLVVTEFVVKHV